MKKKSQEQDTFQEIEIQGNKGANYIRIGKYGEGDNRIFLEVGDCCVVTFRGIVTAEMFSNFLTNIALKENKNLLDLMKEEMTWKLVINKQFCKGAKLLSWGEWE